MAKSNQSKKVETCKKCEHSLETLVFKDGKKKVCPDCGWSPDKKGKSSKADPVTEIQKVEEKKESKPKKMSILKALKELAPSKNFTASDMIKSIKTKYPDFKFKDVSISLHLNALDIGNEKAKLSNPSLAKNAFLIKVEKGIYKRA